MATVKNVLILLAIFGVCSCFRAPQQPSNLSSTPHTGSPQSQSGFQAHQTKNRNDPASVKGELENGNRRFILGRSTHPHQSVSRRVELGAGQKPHTIVLSCSDSRVPPEVIFDQGLGDLFVIRTAGEVADAAAVASIEYAVEHIGTPLLVVMGHQSCGAVTAALKTDPGKSAGSRDLDTLVKSIQPNLRSLSAADKDPSKDKTVTAASMAQVRGVKQALMQRSKIIAEAVHHRRLEIVQALYHLETGEVEFF